MGKILKLILTVIVLMIIGGLVYTLVLGNTIADLDKKKDETHDYIQVDIGELLSKDNVEKYKNEWIETKGVVEKIGDGFIQLAGNPPIRIELDENQDTSNIVVGDTIRFKGLNIGLFDQENLLKVEKGEIKK